MVCGNQLDSHEPMTRPLARHSRARITCHIIVGASGAHSVVVQGAALNDSCYIIVGAVGAHSIVVQGTALNESWLVGAPRVHIPCVAVGTPQAGPPGWETNISYSQLLRCASHWRAHLGLRVTSLIRNLNNPSKCCGVHAIGGHTWVSD